MKTPQPKMKVVPRIDNTTITVLLMLSPFAANPVGSQPCQNLTHCLIGKKRTYYYHG